MGSFAPMPYDSAFAEAEKYLSKGKLKTERPVASNTRLVRINDDTIALVLHSTAVVTYHRDGTFTIYGGGWNTPTTKRRIGDFSPVRIHSQDGEWVVGYTGETTPARVQKCRTCKGRGRWMEDDRCYGPSYDWETYRRQDACEHGEKGWHTLPTQHENVCYRCKGEGRVDYGSKPIPITVSAGTPYVVDAKGKYLGLADTYPETWGKPAVATFAYHAGKSINSGHHMGGEVADKLATILPAMNAPVKHPVSGDSVKLRDVIVSLNDTHHWTREQIADWLDTLDLDLSFPAAS